jgi:hypothetical protein
LRRSLGEGFPDNEAVQRKLLQAFLQGKSRKVHGDWFVQPLKATDLHTDPAGDLVEDPGEWRPLSTYTETALFPLHR